MKYRLLSKVFGVLLVLIAASMLLCWFGTLFEPQLPEKQARAGLFTSFLITAAFGGTLYGWGRGAPNEIHRREAIVIVGVAWLLCSAFGSLPYMLCQPGMNFAKAFFETMSGYTTTGASAIPDLEKYPHSLLFYRSLTHWLGGMGILVLFVALLSFLGVGSKTIMQYESSIQIGEGAFARVRELALRLWLIYIGLTAVSIAALLGCGMSVFDAVNHGFSAIATGGFSTHNRSVAHYESVPLELCLMVIMLLGSLNFLLYVAILRQRWERVKIDEELRAYLIMLTLAILFIACDIKFTHPEIPFKNALRDAAFPVIATSSTSGFATADYDGWPAASKVVILLLMIVGGCVGSTSGGIKMARVVLFGKIFQQELVKVYRPNQVFSIRMNRGVLDESVRMQTMFFLAIVLMTIFGSTFVVAVLDPKLSLEASLGAVIGMVGNVGPGLSELGPTDNFSAVTPGALLYFSLLMAMGRLELFAILILFLPSLWRKY